MPSFDIVSKIDGQTLDNAINTAKKEILNRYDFNDSKSTIDLDKKTNVVTIVTENDMRVKAIEDSIISRMVKQQLDPKALDFGKEIAASGNMIRKEIKIKQGLDQDTAYFSGPGVYSPVRSYETVLEATYQYQAMPWWVIQPDIQYVINPGAGIADPDNPTQALKNELVLGVRTNITF